EVSRTLRRVPLGIGAEGAGGAGQTVVDNGGPVIAHVQVQLIFWGSAWSGSASPSAAEIHGAVKKILAGSYMSALSQYRGVCGGSVAGMTLVTGSEPPNPFSNGDVTNLIAGLISAGTVPGPAMDGQLFYCVVMAPGVISTQPFFGEHSYFSVSGANARYA